MTSFWLIWSFDAVLSSISVIIALPRGISEEKRLQMVVTIDEKHFEASRTSKIKF